MKKRLLLIMMILSTLLASSCVTSIESTGTEITPSGTLRVTLSNIVNIDEILAEADGIRLSGQLDITRTTEDSAEVVQTIPSSTITIEKIDKTDKSIVILVPYTGLSYDTRYSLNVTNLVVHLTKGDEILLSLPGELSNSFTVCSASDVPPAITAEPVVPTTGDSTTPILWLAAAVLAMTGTVLLMRRRA